MKQYIKNTPLTEDEMIAAMTIIMDGRAEESDIETFLTTLASRDETVEEITGAARVLRAKALHIQAPAGAVDCCGTGGDGHGTYNISTAVALVAASCGVPMAKHGNRASSSKSGAADVLEALGVNLDAPQDRLEHALKTLNFAFLMAPHHHSAMKHVAAIRKKLGRRTIFNLLGPLANPAGTQYQLMGVYERKQVRPIAETLRNLGTKRAWVVHGADGLDEITVTDQTHAAILHDDGTIEERTLSPSNFGLPQHNMDSLVGGNAQDNAAALMALLKGSPGAYRDIVLANTAGVLCIHGTAPNIKTGVSMAAQALDQGHALSLLNNYIAHTKGP